MHKVEQESRVGLNSWTMEVWTVVIEGGWRYSGLTSALDIFATSIDAAGVAAESAEDLDGVSLLPYLQGEKPGDPQNRFTGARTRWQRLGLGTTS